MSVVTLAELKAIFTDGQFPNGSNFTDLIDTLAAQQAGSLMLFGTVTPTNASGKLGDMWIILNPTALTHGNVYSRDAYTNTDIGSSTDWTQKGKLAAGVITYGSSDEVLNNSTVIGTTVTDALNWLKNNGGGGSSKWEVVSVGGADYLTPVAGLPDKISTDYGHFTGQLNVGAAIGVSGDYAALSPGMLLIFNGTVADLCSLSVENDGTTNLIASSRLSLSANSGRITLDASEDTYVTNSLNVGSYDPLEANVTYGRIDGINASITLNASDTPATNTAIFIGVNDTTQRARIVTTKNIGSPAKLEISALMTGTKTSSGWLALDADSCLTLATPTYSDVGAQQASTILGTLSALTDAHGWLHNDGAGVLSYSTPTASDVGADPAGTAAGLVANYLPLTGGTITGSLIIGDDGTDTVKFNAAILGSVTAFSDSNIDFGTSAKRFGIAWFKAFVSRSASATNTSYYANTTADTTFRFTIDASGKHTWGAGGTDALDANCNLYRYAANVLSTDGGLRVGGATTLAALAGTGTRFATASSTGLLGAVDLFGTANTWSATQTLSSGNLVVNAGYVYATAAGGGAQAGIFRSDYNGLTDLFTLRNDDSGANAAVGLRVSLNYGAGVTDTFRYRVSKNGTSGSTVTLQQRNAAGTVVDFLTSTDAAVSTFASTLKSAGNQYAVASKTADYVLTSLDRVVVLTGTTGRTFTLPDASGSGQVFTMCNECTGGALLTIALNSGDSVNGSTASFTIPQNQSVTVCDYADEKWVIL